MINRKTGTDIRAIMKISAQLVGPKDSQLPLKLDLSDLKDSNVHLRLPPEINPVV